MDQDRRTPEGWSVTAIAAAAVASLALLLLARYGYTERGLRLVIRSTAQASFALFLCAFSATALLRLWPSPFSRWLRRNRRYVGVSFAASHALHLAGIVALASLTGGASVADTPAAELAGGGLAYLFIAAMAATSSDRAVSRMGRRPWAALHTAGAYYIWAIFMFSYGGRALVSPSYVPFALLLIGALVMRMAARGKEPARRRHAGG